MSGSSAQHGAAAPQSAPYPPTYQALGGTPAIIPDVPVNAVFLLLFIVAGAANMTILQRNQRNGKKFIMNGMSFGFCCTRIIATSLRIAWACYPHNIRLGMAAMIFVYAGVILLLIANLVFAERILRAQHPHFGWTMPVSVIVPALIIITILTVVALIVSVILQFYSLSEDVHRATRDIQEYGATLYAVMAFLPIPVVGVSCLARAHPRIRNTKTIDKFGQGTMRVKIAVCLISAFFLSLGACWRAGTSLLPPTAVLAHPAHGPPQPVPTPWYFSKTAFYLVNFTIEIGVVIFWIVVRIDKRFHVPNGAKGPFSYGGGFTFAGEGGNEKRRLGNSDSMRQLTGSDGALSGRASSRRVSWGGGSSRRSTSRNNRISWGGISRDDVDIAYGEDGVEPMPYPGFEFFTEDPEAQHFVDNDIGIDGAEQEMGWDSKSGKWALRPISMSRPTGGEKSAAESVQLERLSPDGARLSPDSKEQETKAQNEGLLKDVET